MIIATQFNDKLNLRPLIPADKLFEITLHTQSNYMLAHWEETLATDPTFAQQVEKKTAAGGKAGYVMRATSNSFSNVKEVAEQEKALIAKLKSTQEAAYNTGKAKFEQFLTTTYGSNSIALVAHLSNLHCTMYTGYKMPMQAKDITAFKGFLAAAHYSATEVEALFTQFKTYAESMPSQQDHNKPKNAASANGNSKRNK